MYQAGRRAEALAAYQRARTVLSTELGLEPGRSLQDLQRAILADSEQPVAATVGPELGGPLSVPSQLPPGTATFTGRAEHLRQLDALVSDGDWPSRAVVITGPAGVGKTALAVHWAHRVIDRFPDGQLFVNLRGFDPGSSPVSTADAVRLVLDALQVPLHRIASDPDAQLGLYRTLLARRRMLLLLDNARDAEHVRPLLPGSPDCRTVITSRREMPGLVASAGVLPLAVSLMSVEEAHQMLARRLGAGRVIAEPAAATHIVHRCARLPLALAVAAARAATRPGFALRAFADELGDGPDRLDALASADAATDVRAVLSWSYGMLSGDAARLFRLLALHAGPDVGTAAVASLAGAPLRQTRLLLSELVQANLLTEPEPARYGMHDLLRLYATELLDDEESTADRRAAGDRLLDHYLHSGQAADALLRPDQPPIAIAPPRPGVTSQRVASDAAALAWFAAERVALRAAVEHAAATGQDGRTLQLASTLATYLDRSGHWDDLAATQHAAVSAAHRATDATAEANARRFLARAYTRQDRLDDADDQLRHTLALYERAGDQHGQAQTHLNLALLLERRGEVGNSLAHARRGLELFDAVGSRHGQARALNAVGWYHALLGDHRHAIAYCERALATLERVGDRTAQANTWDSLAYAHRHLGQHDRAAMCHHRAIELYRGAGDRHLEGIALAHLGDTHKHRGDLRAARRAWRRALALLADIDHREAQAVRDRLTDRTPA